MMKEWIDGHGLLLGATGAAALVGFLAAQVLIRPAPPAIQVNALEPRPTPTVQVYVHVDGAVAEPGVYRLAGDARIFEAIDAAGGATNEADVTGLNLAARVADGQKLVIPGRLSIPGDDVMAQGAAAQSAAILGSRAASGAGSVTSASARININTATQRILETLPGIGPVTATRILEYRQANGGFTRIEQLRNAGVNASTYERIKDLVTVG